MNTSTTISIRGIALGALAVIGLGAGLSVRADEDPPSITVKYGDLNINSQTGAEALYHRIQRAAKKVCAWEYDAAVPEVVRVCYLKAVADAVTKVNSAPLNAVHLHKAITSQG